ncbi:MAG: hypothetical protein QOJ08_792 [Ilumatobacteraceae bacterium]|jgi:hypothetical protein
MNSPNDAHPEPRDDADVDPLDREAAEIDARSEDAPEKIEKLIDDAEALGRPVTQEVDPDQDDDPEVLPG